MSNEYVTIQPHLARGKRLRSEVISSRDRRLHSHAGWGMHPRNIAHSGAGGGRRMMRPNPGAAWHRKRYNDYLRQPGYGAQLMAAANAEAITASDLMGMPNPHRRRHNPKKMGTGKKLLIGVGALAAFVFLCFKFDKDLNP